MKLIFDLDGTLIDARLRLHRLFCHLVPEAGLDFDAYWALKRDKQGHAAILARQLGWDAEAIASFEQAWLACIEGPRWLALDQVLPGIPDALARLGTQAELWLCTARQFRAPVLLQLQTLGLLRHFQQVLVTGQQESKEALVRRSAPRLDSGDWLIGDTGHDVRTAQALGIRSCAVLSGFLGRKQLLAYVPDLLLDSVADFRPDAALQSGRFARHTQRALTP